MELDDTCLDHNVTPEGHRNDVAALFECSYWKLVSSVTAGICESFSSLTAGFSASGGAGKTPSPAQTFAA